MTKDRWDGLRILFAITVGAFLLSMLLVTGCTDPRGTARVLEQNGYTDVEITGWRPLAADKGDYFATGFRAKSVTGTEVTGTVTRGWFKGNTIRLD
jgi:hypothetical protein